MSYLERNAQLIAEVGRSLRLRKGLEVGRSDNGTVFYSAGSYHSTILGKEVFVGIKEFACPVDAEYNLLWGLRFARKAVEEIPKFSEEVPLFQGLLIDKGARPLALVMEDFSKGNMFRVHYPSNKELPHEINKLFGEYPVSQYELRHLAFVINRERRLGDFSTIFSSIMSLKEQERLFPVRDIYVLRDAFTIRLDYEL